MMVSIFSWYSFSAVIVTKTETGTHCNIKWKREGEVLNGLSLYKYIKRI